MESHNKIILSIFVLLPLFTGGLAVGGLQTAYATGFSCGNGICDIDEDKGNCSVDCGEPECTSDAECQGGGICEQEVFIQFECIDFVCEQDSTEDCSDDGDLCNGITACDDNQGCVEDEPPVQCGAVQCGDVQCRPSSGICDVFNDNDAECQGGGSEFCEQDVLKVEECQDGFCIEDRPPENCSDVGNECNAGVCDPNQGCIVDPGPFNGEECDGGIGLCTDGECIPKDADIHVIKFNDLNADGVQDEGEDGIEGWGISLQCMDDFGNILLSNASTDDKGMVWFVDIPVPNQCTVFEEQRLNWFPTTPTSVTIELNPEDKKEVTFGNVRPLETEKFYTETDKDIEDGFFGTLLPIKDDGTQTVQAVIHPKNGKITSYNPGQYYAVTKVTAFVDLATVSIFEEDFDCTDRVKPISIWNPAKVPGGAYVAMMCPDGTTVDLTSELANADPPQLFRNDLGVLEAHVEDVKAGCMVFLGVKYSPGLKGEAIEELQPPDLFCENLEIVCANLTDEPIPFPGVYRDMIACISDVTDSAHRILEVVKCGENEVEDLLTNECVCIEGFEETPGGICVAAEF